MPLILDTEFLPAAERAERYVEVLKTTSGSSSVEPDMSRGAPTSQMRYTQTGRGALFTNKSSGTRISLSPKEAADTDDAFMAVAVQMHGTALRRTPLAGERLERPGDLFIVDQRQGFDVRWTNISSTAAFLIPRDTLGSTHAEQDVAAGLISSSPLYPMLRRHMAEMARLPDAILQGPVGQNLDEATIHLVGALLSSTKDRRQFLRETSATSAMSMVRTFVRQHIRDPDLDATTIAKALHVSRRTVYRLFAQEPMKLQQLIISERLLAARIELEAYPLTTIETIAQRFSFKDPRHFSRRFKDQFGLTPQDYRAQFGSRRDGR